VGASVAIRNQSTDPGPHPADSVRRAGGSHERRFRSTAGRRATSASPQAATDVTKTTIKTGASAGKRAVRSRRRVHSWSNVHDRSRDDRGIGRRSEGSGGLLLCRGGRRRRGVETTATGGQAEGAQRLFGAARFRPLLIRAGTWPKPHRSPRRAADRNLECDRLPITVHANRPSRPRQLTRPRPAGARRAGKGRRATSGGRRTGDVGKAQERTAAHKREGLASPQQQTRRRRAEGPGNPEPRG